MKKCPFCAEEIQSEAIKCRFCGESLKKKRRWVNCLLGCLIAFVALNILTFLFIYFSLLSLKYIFHKMFSAVFLPPYVFPFTGMADVFKGLGGVLGLLFERLKDLLQFGVQPHSATF